MHLLDCCGEVDKGLNRNFYILVRICGSYWVRIWVIRSTQVLVVCYIRTVHLEGNKFVKAEGWKAEWVALISRNCGKFLLKV